MIILIVNILNSRTLKYLELGMKINMYVFVKVYLGLGVVETTSYGYGINDKMNVLNWQLDNLEHNKLWIYMRFGINGYIWQIEREW